MGGRSFDIICGAFGHGLEPTWPLTMHSVQKMNIQTNLCQVYSMAFQNHLSEQDLTSYVYRKVSNLKITIYELSFKDVPTFNSCTSLLTSPDNMTF